MLSRMDALIGALVGAVVGSFLGYLANYFAMSRRAAVETTLRRRRLMKALQVELGMITSLPPPEREAGVAMLWSGAHFATLHPLIALAAEDPDPHYRFLDALVHLEDTIANYNDLVAVTNFVAITPNLGDVANQSAYDSSVTRWTEMRDAAHSIRPMLEIPY
jgi:hypothetical protein